MGSQKKYPRATKGGVFDQNLSEVEEQYSLAHLNGGTGEEQQGDRIYIKRTAKGGVLYILSPKEAPFPGEIWKEKTGPITIGRKSRHLIPKRSKKQKKMGKGERLRSSQTTGLIFEKTGKSVKVERGERPR